ncbi:MAG: tetratricopeptide repeat protein, partial [Pseudobdellovibrionaceae bacterium]
MKKLTLFLILILSTLTAFRTTVHAEKMDSETQNLVIEKMERVLSLMTKKDSSWGPTQVRLADLLAERARLRFMNEVEANCDACKGSRSDRKKALSLYQQVLPTLTYTQKGRVYFQMAHLHQMAGEDSSAITIFEGILKNQNSYSNDVVTRAHVALADLLFQNTKFKKAMEHYLLALKDPNVAQKGIIHYRLAWCDFNMDRLPKAIRSLETLARTPSLLTKETSDGKVIADSAFQNDIMRDLATFYSRQKITSDEISTYQSLTPDSQKKELLMFFGQEADRLGQKQAAADIYKIYLATAILDPEEQLEAFMLMAQANYDKGQTAQSTQDFSTAAAAYKKTACYNNPKKTEETQGTCDKIQKRMKHFVTEFHRSKKSKPNTDVLNAYVVYAQTFPQDTQMAILGAQVASELKQHRAAASLYRFGSEFAKDDTLRDKALVGELEATEKTGDAKLKEDVYKRYLAVRPNGANSYKVRYQLAHVNYDKKDWKVASIQFHDLALTPTGNPELRKKSADLALDSLAIQKNDTLIEQWASEFAAALPQHREEFTSIQRKAVLNQTASTANSNKASDSDLKAALRKMQKVSLSNSTDTEKIVHYRNQLVLADKLNDETAILSSLTLLLSVPSLSAEDKEHALARKVGFYEKRLDFKSAYQTALRMRFPNISSAEKEVRLGTLAELAGLRGTAHYKAALDKGLKGPSKATVLSRMIQSSSSPKADIKRYKKAFLQYPGVFSEILILVYNETKNLNDIEPYLKSKKMAQTPAGKFVRKQ